MTAATFGRPEMTLAFALDHSVFVLPNFVVPVIVTVAVCWLRWRRR